MRTGVHFSRFATPEMLCAWLGPYTHAMRSRRSGRSCQRSPWAMATGLVEVVDAPVSCQADRFWPPMSASVKPRRTECVYCPVPASCMAGCFRQAAHDRSIQADERAVIPILQVCSATTCVCSCRRAINPRDISGRAESESFMSHICDYPVGSVCCFCSRSSLLILQRRGQPANLIERHRYSQLRRTEALGHTATLGRCRRRELIEYHQHRDRKEGRMGGIQEWDVGSPAKLRHQAGTEHTLSFSRAQSTGLTDWVARTLNLAGIVGAAVRAATVVYHMSKGSRRAAPGWAWLGLLGRDSHVSWDVNMYNRYVPVG